MPKTPERCQELREETRKKILRDAILYFARNGFAGTKIRVIFSKMGKNCTDFLKKIKEKIYSAEDKLRSFILDPRVFTVIFLTVVSALAILLRWFTRDFETEDYKYYLSVWFDTLKENGGFAGLKLSLGDYNVPYLTILAFLTYLPFDSLYSIKFVSCVFDFVLAIFAALLTREFKKGEKAGLYACIAYAVTLFLPTVFVNSALWAQCDSIYVSFMLISLYFLKREKITLSFLALGVAFAFKLQFIFILPLYILLYFRKRGIRLWHFLLLFVTDIVLCLPAVFAGRSLADCLSIYVTQGGEYSYSITLNYPNVYALVGKFFEKETAWLSVFAVALVGVLAFYILYKRREVEKDILRYGLLFSLIMVNFLPCMHERYGYFMEVLAVVYVLTRRRDYYLPIVLQLCNLSGYANYLASSSLAWSNNYYLIAALVQTVVVLKFTYDTLKDVPMSESMKEKADER